MIPFIGEIRLLPYKFAPQGWALCNGQLLQISSNAELYSVIGAVYGGDGVTTFALPDLQGRVVPGVGQGPGLQEWTLGMQAGEDSVFLLGSQMPSHNHGINGLELTGIVDAPVADAYLAQDRRGGQGNINFLVSSATTPDITLSPQALSISGGSQAHENRQPFLSLNYYIALEGIFPGGS